MDHQLKRQINKLNSLRFNVPYKQLVPLQIHQLFLVCFYANICAKRVLQEQILYQNKLLVNSWTLATYVGEPPRGVCQVLGVALHSFQDQTSQNKTLPDHFQVERTREGTGGNGISDEVDRKFLTEARAVRKYLVLS